jgi:hypothetical protein
MQANGAVLGGRRLVEADQHAAAGLTADAAEDFLAMFPHHFFRCQTEEFLGGAVDASDSEIRVVQDKSVGKLVENCFQKTGPPPFWG